MSAYYQELAMEKKTISAMISLYCHGKHSSSRGSLCGDCVELFDYAMVRLSGCPFGSLKPTCRNCRVHCWDTEHRERIVAVMRYAGPRMIYTHPLMSLSHALNELRKT
jgi:hypothetical protein